MVIGNSVTNIWDETFFGCTGLTKVTIGRSVTNLGAFAFDACTSLTTIAVDASNPAYSSLDGVLFNKSQTMLLLFPQGKAASYTIPDSVISIGNYAFSGCTKLTGVTIPDSVTSLGDYVFGFCAALTNVTVGKKVSSIGSDAFTGCTNLSAIYFAGRAPAVATTAFQFDSQAIVYYLPGTTGWSSALAGRPTTFWLPAVTVDAALGMRSNRFGFNINWARDTTVVVDAATNLLDPVWTPVSTNLLTGGTPYFSDPQWTNYPSRLYRLRTPAN